MSLTGATTTTDPTPAHSPPLSPTHELPGEIFIDPDERAGLPGAGRSTDVAARAENVVKMHKRGLFGRGGIFGKPEKQEKGAGARKGKVRKRRQDSDVEADSDSVAAGMRGGGLGGLGGLGGGVNGGGKMGTGVLSALLTLYDQPQAGESSTSGFTSGATTPGDEYGHSSSNYYSSRRHHRHKEKEKDKHDKDRERHSTSSRPSSGFFGLGHANNASSTSVGSGSGSGTAQKAKRRLSAGMGLKLGDDRPSQSRNAAGVFGALVASTGNISGVAAPAPSTLAPNPKRPGYHLSRSVSSPLTPPISFPYSLAVYIWFGWVVG